jgi:hypothetical protein
VLLLLLLLLLLLPQEVMRKDIEVLSLFREDEQSAVRLSSDGAAAPQVHMPRCARLMLAGVDSSAKRPAPSSWLVLKHYGG